jgi:hypothetical protein
MAPWDQGFGTNGGQPNIFSRKMRCNGRNSTFGADGPPSRRGSEGVKRETDTVLLVALVFLAARDAPILADL